MTTTTVITISAIVLAFVTFGAVLAWADFYSRPARRLRALEQPQPVSNGSSHLTERRAAA